MEEQDEYVNLRQYKMTLMIRIVLCAICNCALMGAVLPDSAGVTVDAGAPLRHRAPVQYPMATNVTGTVVVDVKVNSQGIVTGASVQNGPDALRDAAKLSVLEWHYQKGTPSKVTATITFTEAIWIPAPPPYQPPLPGPPVTIRVPITVTPPPAPKPGSEFRIRNVRFAGLSTELEEEVRERLHLAQGEPLTVKEDDFREAIQKIDPHFDIAVLNRSSSAELLIMLLPQDLEGLCKALGISMPTATTTDQPLRRAYPVYPRAAKQDRVQGTIRLMAVIDPNGNVIEAIAMSGPLPLRRSAEDTLRQWIFAPGPEVRSVMTEISFALN